MGDCHECNCFVDPPCGACERCKRWYVDDCPNDCQFCEYDHERTGPYRLTDGTWSDGVDRLECIKLRRPPNKRWQVYQCATDYWEAYAESDGRQLDEIAPSDAPALALAILEAAGYTEAEYVDEWPNVNRAVFSLRLGIEEQEREASRAKEQAELEAEALELYNARISFLGGEALTSFEKLNQDNKDMWLAVARKAREMRTEK